jgi:hypothetical protein
MEAFSPAQAAAIADAASADPSSESKLLETPKEACLGELRLECARTKAAATDPEERRRRIHDRRCLRTYPDAEGAGTSRCGTTPRWGPTSWRCSFPCIWTPGPGPGPRDDTSPWRPTAPNHGPDGGHGGRAG